MDVWKALAPLLRDYLPLLLVLAVASAALALGRALLAARQRRTGAPASFGRQMIMLALTAGAIVAAVLALPVSDTVRGQLLSLLGLVLTVVIAFSSTTFVANAMAGLMLRAVGNFRPGDFLHVGDQFGRVTERSLFHTEIQTEDRDLATLPNLYLVTQPVTVVRASGTIVSTTLSLGYDLAHDRIEALLVEAARAAGLEEPFVQILELGDFSVRYRVAGFLADVTRILTTRSNLRASVLDTLHGAGVEIVSPTFMNQRSLAEGVRFVATREEARQAPPAAETPSPEAIIFDKAEAKASLEALRSEREKLLVEIAALGKSAAEVPEAERPSIDAEIARRQQRSEEIAAALERAGKAEEPEGGPA